MKHHRTDEEGSWTILQLLQWTTRYFTSHHLDSPRADAEILLAHVLQGRRIDLYLRHDQPLNAAELAAFKALIKRRVRREPVAYIVGRREFWSMALRVTRDVLIPRPETECLVETVLAHLPPRDGATCRRVLELGTGSGAIAMALAAERGGHRYFATDASAAAVRVARHNARTHHLDPEIEFWVGSWFAALADARATFDLIVSNPPYVPSEEIPKLQPEIFRYEPRGALDGGGDGLDAIRHIIAGAYRYLRPGGLLLVEIGHDQRCRAAAFSEQTERYEAPVCYPDYGGCDRVMLLRRRQAGDR